MKQHGLVNVLARLLADPALRRRFESSRESVLNELGLDEQEAQALCQLDLATLNRQAESLIRKRHAEVARLLPATWKQGGDEIVTAFADYARQAPWPEGHQRHWLDAASFCRYLNSRDASPVVVSEQHWINFVVGDKHREVRTFREAARDGSTALVLLFMTRDRRNIPRRVSFRIPWLRRKPATLDSSDEPETS